jgi:CRP/FNR family transcriptional regulator, dissimilatory nitrate respiration regulator
MGDRRHRTHISSGIEKGHGVRTVAQSNSNPSYLEFWQALDGLKSVRTYDKGTSVFRQGRPAQGIYLVEKGEVRLTLAASAKPEHTFEIAGAGSVLGLSETLSGDAHKLGAEAASQVEIAYVERGSLLDFLRNHHEFCLQIVRLLSEDLHGLYQRFQCMSSEGKLRRKASPASLN